MMGASGPRMLRLAAREANIVGILGGPERNLSEQVAVVRKAAGERYDQIELTNLFFNVSVNGAPSGSPPNRPGIAGSVDQVVEHFQKLREENDISYIMVIGPVIESFAPVVAKLAGT